MGLNVEAFGALCLRSGLGVEEFWVWGACSGGGDESRAITHWMLGMVVRKMAKSVRVGSSRGDAQDFSVCCAKRNSLDK